MKAVKEILGEMSSYLEGRNIPSPKRLAEELLGAALNLKRLDLYLNFERPLVEEELAFCQKVLRRAGEGEPLAYILGEVEFYGARLKVDKRVLIPRPETELIVDKIVGELKEKPLKGKTLWDLCTGSGCIGLALKKSLPDLQVLCSDISGEALDVASQNALDNGLDIAFYQGDFLDAFPGPVDYLVTNPPYVDEGEALPFEPRIALVGGLTFYERLATGLSQRLVPGGKAWMEIGASQGKAVKALFSHSPYCRVTLSSDLAGLDRLISLEIQG